MLFPQPTQMCWICGKAVAAETRKTDEHGSTVHERCHAVKLALAIETLNTGKIRPKSATRPNPMDVAIAHS